MPTYTNLIVLQGWLELESISVVTVQREQVPVLNGWIHTTDQEGLEDVFDGRHAVLISGRAAEAVLEINRKLNEKLPYTAEVGLVHVAMGESQAAQMLANRGRPFVIAQGRLLSRREHTCVEVKHLSVLGLPWGALDALAELEPGLPADVHALIAGLSSTEKSQIGQAVAVALRSLVALRCDDASPGQP